MGWKFDALTWGAAYAVSLVSRVCEFGWSSPTAATVAAIGWDIAKREHHGRLGRGDWVLWGDTTWSVIEWAADTLVQYMMIAAVSSIIFDGIVEQGAKWGDEAAQVLAPYVDDMVQVGSVGPVQYGIEEFAEWGYEEILRWVVSQ